MKNTPLRMLCMFFALVNLLTAPGFIPYALAAEPITISQFREINSVNDTEPSEGAVNQEPVPSPTESAGAPEASQATWNTVAWTVVSIKYNAPIVISEHDAELIAKTIYGEARGSAVLEQAAVAWCILNRADSLGENVPNSVEKVITYPGQFMGYSPKNPLIKELLELAKDVLLRHEQEKRGMTDTGRVLPKEYLWFSGDSRHNYFRNSYSGGQTWDWSLPNPYISC